MRVGTGVDDATAARPGLKCLRDPAPCPTSPWRDPPGARDAPGPSPIVVRANAVQIHRTLPHSAALCRTRPHFTTLQRPTPFATASGVFAGWTGDRLSSPELDGRASFQGMDP